VSDIAKAGSTLASGRVLQVNVSPGGVPKMPVDRAWVGRYGLEGDKHRESTVHGGPHRAVCLFGMEVIDRLQAEGHPIIAGGAGENLTTWGIEWSLLPIGAIVQVGHEVVLELASSTTPCATQTYNFSDGNFNRILIDKHPSDSRMYARVVREGIVAPDDPIVVTAAGVHSTAVDALTLRWLDRAEGKSSIAAWKAARSAGFEVDIYESGEISMASSRQLPGPAFNQAHGFAGLPNLLPMALDYFDRRGTRGWIWAEDAPWVGAEPDLTLGMFAAAPGDIAELPTPQGVLIRRVQPDDTADFASVETGNTSAGGMDAGTVDPWPAVLRELARTSSRTIFVAEIDGEVVGNASLHVSGKTGWMRGAVVAQRARGRGIQRAFIAARARAAEEIGCNLVGASAEPELTSARNLRASGMRMIGMRSNYIYDPK
jgi:MOSC domain-containing protein YiiM/GNAT superfamily N-acetyltransferase